LRVLLINPFYPISETPSPPLGLAYLAGALEAAGVAVKILDCVVSPLCDDLLSALLNEFKPDLVGATAVTMTVDHALTVLERIKTLDPDIPTVLGGPHATFCAADILASFPQVDAVVRGEGERSLVALARAVEDRSPWNRVPGIAFREKNHIVTTDLPPLADLNELPPPARQGIPLGRYRALGMPVSMTTSRGCPFKCIFCVGRKMVGAKVRYRDPVRVVDEMAALNRLGFHQINLADDLFTANRNHCLAVCNEIMHRGLTVNWTSFARVDTVARQTLEAMRRAGCTTISFGIESGSPEMLKRIKKGITLAQARRAMQLCLDCGIEPHASFILGLPGETPQTLRQTLEFGETLQNMGANHGFHILAPFPGTDIRERIGKYDLQILSDDWREYHANRAVVRTAGVTPETMNAIVIESEKEFDRWLAKIGRRRAMGLADGNESWPLTRLEHTVVIYDMMMKRLIEKRGFWPIDASQDNPGQPGEQLPVEQLIQRATEDLDHPVQRIRAAIEFAVTENYLEVTKTSGRVSWSWVEGFAR
jgi:anaerobic magnesium-protoporphyrin IX monomethyl ester cyclase